MSRILEFRHGYYGSLVLSCLTDSILFIVSNHDLSCLCIVLKPNSIEYNNKNVLKEDEWLIKKMAGLEIHEAAATGDCDSLEEYLKNSKIDVNLKDVEWDERTALHWACMKGEAFKIKRPPPISAKTY